MLSGAAGCIDKSSGATSSPACARACAATVSIPTPTRAAIHLITFMKSPSRAPATVTASRSKLKGCRRDVTEGARELRHEQLQEVREVMPEVQIAADLGVEDGQQAVEQQHAGDRADFAEAGGWRFLFAEDADLADADRDAEDDRVDRVRVVR